jgi:VWFA-related protein
LEFGSSVKRLKWDPARQVAVETSSGEKQPLVPVEDVIRVEIELVVCDVLIQDGRGHIVRGLRQEDFTVAEDGTPQKISHFSLGEDREVERSIVLVIDYSGSEVPYLKTSVEAATTLVDKLGPKDRMAIVTDDVELLVEFTRDKKRLKDALKSLRNKAGDGRSKQFTALLATARELFSNEDFRRVIIFQTDGDEIISLQPYSTVLIEQIIEPGTSQEQREEFLKRAQAAARQFSLKDISTALEKSGATVYGVFPGSSLIGLPLSSQLDLIKVAWPRMKKPWRLAQLAAWQLAGQVAMTEVAQMSGGSIAYLETPDQAREIYSRILSDMNSRYVIGYYPTNKVRDGKRRKVLVGVRNHPEYTVEGRKTYYAPGPE